MRFLVVTLVMLVGASCTPAPKPVPPAPVRTTVQPPSPLIYTSTPSWTSSSETKIPTKLGELRLFNADCGYEVDVALIGEIFDRHTAVKSLSKKLELLTFPHIYVIPLDEDPGFALSNVATEGALNGMTVSSPYDNLVVSVIPTGWARDNMPYAIACGRKPILARAEVLLTLATTHELVGHGVKRSALTEWTPEEECEMQFLEDRVLQELDGRVAFRKKR